MFQLPSDKKRIIEDVIGIFETGKRGGDYSTTVYLADGAGITYGKHQAIDKSGSLDAIVKRYIKLGSRGAGKLKPYLEMLEANGTVGFDPMNLPDNIKELMRILNAAGDDLIMQQAQDEVFDEWYWEPMAIQCREMQLTLPLSWLVVYDSSIHSGPKGISYIRKMFTEMPPSGGGDEKLWVKAYIKARRNWLATHKKTILHATVYRMDSILQLIEEDNWELTIPFTLFRPRVTLS